MSGSEWAKAQLRGWAAGRFWLAGPQRPGSVRGLILTCPSHPELRACPRAPCRAHQAAAALLKAAAQPSDDMPRYEASFLSKPSGFLLADSRLPAINYNRGDYCGNSSLRRIEDSLVYSRSGETIPE